MIKMILSDVDGTILQGRMETPSQQLFELIRECTSRGIRFVVASGRQYANLRRIFAPVWRDIIFVAENGAVVVDNDQVIFTRAVPRQLAEPIISDLENRDGCHAIICALNVSFVTDLDEDITRYLTFVLKNNVSYTNCFWDLDEPCLKVSAYIPGNTAADLIEEYKARFGECVYVAMSGEDTIDFGSASKGSALRFLQKKLGISSEATVVFGDNFNDIEMFKAAGISYAMETAADGVKECSTYTAATVESVVADLLGGNV